MQYVNSVAEIGPLALKSEPGAYDLCLEHATSLTVPNGWEIVRLPGELDATAVSEPELEALAAAVRRAGLGEGTPPPIARRKRHLAVVADLG
jgi:hypothetical protein